MRMIGFSTGALAKGDLAGALRMLTRVSTGAIEVSALRQDELVPIVGQMPHLDFTPYRYKAFHAPSYMDREREPFALSMLQKVSALGWPIIVHPDVIYTPAAWKDFGQLLCIENMDKRKAIGRTASEMSAIFDQLPDASFCLDVGHVRQIDPTMSEAATMLHRFAGRLRQLHVSEVNAQSKHGPLTCEAVLAFKRIARLVPADTPIILESQVSASEIEQEIQNALHAFEPSEDLALAGD